MVIDFALHNLLCDCVCAFCKKLKKYMYIILFNLNRNVILFKMEMISIDIGIGQLTFRNFKIFLIITDILINFKQSSAEIL